MFAFLLRALLALVLLAAALAVVSRQFVMGRLNEEIRSRIQAALQAHYPLQVVAVRSVRRLGEAGIEVRGVSISDPTLQGEASKLLAVDELLMACPADLAGLVAKKWRVRQLVVRHAKLCAQRRKDGSWSIAALLPLPKSGDGLPRVTIENSELAILGAAEGADRLLTLRDIQLEMAPEASPPVAFAQGVAAKGPQFRVRGTMTGDQFERIRVDGRLAPREGLWTIGGSVEGLQVSPRLIAALFTDTAAGSGLPSLQGRAAFDFRASRLESGQAPLRFAVSGKLWDGRVQDPRLPYPATDVQARFHADNQGVQIVDLTARSGQTSVQLACEIKGLSLSAPTTLRASAKHLDLNERLASALPAKVRDWWRKISPSGLANADLKLDFDGTAWTPELRLECLDVSLAYHKFPYRVRQACGVATLKDNVLSFRGFQAKAAGQVIRLDGEFRNLGPRSSGWIEVLLEEPIPLDEDLLSALEEQPRRVVRSLHLGAMITVWARIECRDGPTPSVRQRMKIGLHRCSLCYEPFPYPLTSVRGTLEMNDGEWVFRDLQGCNDSGYITCQGNWTPKAGGGELTLDFVAQDVPLEDELRDALRPSVRRLWTGLRPRGVIDRLNIGLRYDSVSKSTSLEVHAQKWPTDSAEGRSITVEPLWPPYRLDKVTGAFRYHQGRVELAKIRAEHGETVWEADGDCSFGDDGRWTAKLTRLAADRLQWDRELTSALPPALGQALAKLNLRGALGVDGALSLAGGQPADGRTAWNWDLVFDVEDGAFHCGPPLDHVRGEVRLTGGYDDHGFRSQGQLAIDSMMFRGNQLTQVQGPFWIDESQVVLGRGSRRKDAGGSSQPLTAQALGGAVSLDAQLALSDESRFAVWCSLDKGDLSQVSRDLTANPQELRGKLFGFVQLSGAASGVHTWRGDGWVRLRDADIYRVPLMVALLSLLNLRPPEATGFTTADIDYRVQGDHIYLDRIDFHGDAITLRGSGGMDFDRHIDLQFYTMVGRDEVHVPILRPVLGEASRQFLLIEVVGTCERPEVRPTAFPGLNETLQQIFPEAVKPKSFSPLTLPNPREILERTGVWPGRLGDKR